MKKIIVDDQILAGNLFNESGYDENASADKYAKLLKNVWTKHIEEEFPGVEIEINIDVQHNCSGSGRDMSVIITDDENEDELFSGEEMRLQSWLSNIAEKIEQDDYAVTE